MQRTIARLMAVSALLVLAACGGGGGGSSGLNSIPTPPPPPPTAQSGAAFGVTADTKFAVVGDVEEFRWNEAAKAYEITLTGQQLERLVRGGGTAISEDHYPTTGCCYGVDLLRDNTLSHTAVAVIFENGWRSPLGVFAYGLPTAASNVPVTGTASYEARAVGLAGATSGTWLYDVRGTAQLAFDFGAGTLSGRFDPVVIGVSTNGTDVQLGRYDFVNTIFGVGSPGFSGQLSVASAPSLGAFEGLFTGPAANELMADWQAPFQNPNTNGWETMKGVWIGSRGN